MTPTPPPVSETAAWTADVTYEIWRVDGQPHAVERNMTKDQIAIPFDVWRLAFPDARFVVVQATTSRSRVSDNG